MLKPALCGSNSKYNNRHLILGFLILGRLCSSVYADTPPDEDYAYDEESPADDLKASDMQPKSTMKPFFESPNRTIYARLGEKVVLDCPLKNFDDKHHQLLWWKDNTTLTNGHVPLNPTYELDNNYNLTIVNLTQETQGHYYCRVLPFKDVRRQVVVKIGEPETTDMTHIQVSGGWRDIANISAISLAAIVALFAWI